MANEVLKERFLSADPDDDEISPESDYIFSGQIKINVSGRMRKRNEVAQENDLLNG